MSDDDAIVVVGERRAGSPLAEEATRSKRARGGGDARDGSHPPADPPLFRLFTSRSGDLSRPGGNAGCVSLPDIVSGPVRWCVVMNFMIDLPWLLSPDGCPSLNDVPTVVWVADERNAPRAAFDAMRRGRDWRVVHPQTPKFGTHHTKCFILVYDAGCRVCVHTSNLIELDVHRRANAAWTQDFPLKSRADRDAFGAVSEFEHDLLRYLRRLGWRDAEANGEVIGPGALARFDFRGAGAKLIASVPGRWGGGELSCWGHPAARRALDRRSFPRAFKNAPVACQFTSIGATSERWIAEMADSFGGGRVAMDGGDGVASERTSKPSAGPFARAGDLLGAPREMQLVWPAMEEVRECNLGYLSGGAIPGMTEKIGAPHVRRRLHRWRASGDPRSGDDANGAEEDPMARSRVMPHVKTFARYRPEDASVAWVILGSHNLSGAAWGRLEKNGAQVNILSYELSVLLEPNAIGPRVPTPFTLTAAPSDASAAPGAPPRLARCLCLTSARPRVDANVASANVLESTRPVEIRPARRLPGDDDGDDAEAAEADPRGKGRGDVAWASFPFPLPPPPYAPGDAPWAVNGACDVPDAFGRVMRGGCVEMSPEEVGGATRSNRH